MNQGDVQARAGSVLHPIVGDAGRMAIADRRCEGNGPLEVVLVSAPADVPLPVRVMRAAALDFLTMPVDNARLTSMITPAIRRSRKVAGCLAEPMRARQRIDRFSPRAKQVMRCVVAGLTNQQVAERLGISDRTVEVHRSRMMKKIRAASVAELVQKTFVAL